MSETSQQADARSKGRTAAGVFQAAKEGWLMLLASDPKLSAADLAVGIIIAKHLNSKVRRAWPSLKLIAELANRHVSTVWKSVKKLHRKGLLKIHKGRGRHQFNKYELRLGNLGHDPRPMRSGNKNCADQQEKDCGDDQLTSQEVQRN
jgi:gamma-glutamylcysteine synthetase